MITWITENVAIGEYSDAINRELLEKEKIDCILCLRTFVSNEEDALKEFLQIPLFHISVGDHQGLKPIKIELVTTAYMLGLLSAFYNRILVHCTAGIDRAPFVLALYLTNLSLDFDKTAGLTTIDFNSTFRKAYKFIKEKRPQIKEHYEWV